LKLRIIALFLVLVMAGATVTVKVLTNPKLKDVIRDLLIQQARKHLGVELHIGKLDYDVFLTGLSMENVTLKDLQGKAGEISVRRLGIKFDPLSVFRGTVGIKELQVDGIDLNVVRDMDGTIAVKPLFPFWKKKKSSPGLENISLVHIQVSSVILLNSHISYHDLPAGVEVGLDNVLVRFDRGSFDSPGHGRLSLHANNGKVGWRGFPKGRTISVQSLQAEMTYTPTELLVSKFNLFTDPLGVSFTGTLPLVPSTPLSGSIALTADLGKLPWLIGAGAGKLRFSGEVGGDLRSPYLSGEMEGGKVRVYGRKFNNISARLSLDAGHATLEGLKALYRGENLEGRMEVGFTRGLPFKADLSTSKYPIAKLFQEISGDRSPLEGSFSAQCGIEGYLFPGKGGGRIQVGLKGTADLSIGRGAPKVFGFDLSGVYAGSSYVLERFKAASGSLAMEASGTLGPSGPDLTVKLTESDLGTWENFSWARGAGGTLQADGEVSGDWQAPLANLDLVFQHPSIRGYAADFLKAHLQIDSKGITCPLASLKVGATVLTLQGRLPWKGGDRGGEWSVGTSNGRLQDILQVFHVPLDLSGEIAVQMDFSFRNGSLTGKGDSVLRKIRLNGEEFERSDFHMVLRDGGLVFDKIELTKAGKLMVGRGSIKDGRFSAQLATVHGVPMESLRFLKELKVPLSGEISFTAGVSGGLDGKDIEGTAAAKWDQISFEGRSWGSGKGTFDLKGKTLKGNAELINGKFAAEVTVDLSGEIPFYGTIRTLEKASHEDLNNFFGLGIPSGYASGELLAKAGAKGVLLHLKKTEVEGTIDEARFNIRGIDFRSTRSVPFTYQPERGIRFEDLQLASGESVLRGALTIAPKGIIGGNMEGEIDLGGFSYLRPTVNSFFGRTEIHLRISGTLSHPSLSGYLNIRDTSCVAHLPFPLKVEHLEGRIEILNDRVHFDAITGQVKKGTIEMDGDLFLEGLTPVRGRLQWKGEGIAVNFPDGLSTLNRATIVLSLDGGKGNIRGSVKMDEGKYIRDIDIDNPISLLGESAGAPGPFAPGKGGGNGGTGRFALDIEMETINPIEVDMKLLRGDAKGTLHLQGTVGKPVLTGRFFMDKGDIIYRGKSFAISRGIVGFFNPEVIEPNFDFSARTDISGLDRDGMLRDYTIELLVNGVPSKFKLDLISSPPLSETDILSLLNWGAVSEKAFESGRNVSATEAALFLSSELKGTLESGVRNITGFDRVVIDPVTVSRTGGTTSRIRLDKRLGERLSLSASAAILSREEPEVSLRYKLLDSFSLIGEERGEGNFNLDLDFQFEIR